MENQKQRGPELESANLRWFLGQVLRQENPQQNIDYMNTSTEDLLHAVLRAGYDISINVSPYPGKHGELILAR